MRRSTSIHHDPHSEARQFDLFSPANAGGLEAPPEWRCLPADARRALTHLMARLILEHADSDHAARQEETCHDD
jgi:hypothetical protein